MVFCGVTGCKSQLRLAHYCTCTGCCKAYPQLVWVVLAVELTVTCNSDMDLWHFKCKSIAVSIPLDQAIGFNIAVNFSDCHCCSTGLSIDHSLFRGVSAAVWNNPQLWSLLGVLHCSGVALSSDYSPFRGVLALLWPYAWLGHKSETQ